MRNKSVRISLFHCANAVSSDEIRRFSSRLGNAELIVVNMPCSGKVDIQYLLKSIEAGSDAVVLVGCRSSECRFLQGNLRARKRVGAVNEILEEAGFGPYRAMYIQLHGGQSSDEILRELQECSASIMNEEEKPRES